jgi:transketolase
LGHGLSVGVGLAIAAKRSGQSYKTYILMGDGEQGEGSIMEAAAAAGHYKLGNLMAIIDRNNLQISGLTEEVCAVDDLEGKYRACGWKVAYCNGHDMNELLHALRNTGLSEKPTLVIAHTVKGKGVSFMENIAGWHHKVPTKEQLEQAFSELDKQMEETENGR